VQRCDELQDEKEEGFSGKTDETINWEYMNAVPFPGSIDYVG